MWRAERPDTSSDAALAAELQAQADAETPLMPPPPVAATQPAGPTIHVVQAEQPPAGYFVSYAGDDEWRYRRRQGLLLCLICTLVAILVAAVVLLLLHYREEHSNDDDPMDDDTNDVGADDDIRARFRRRRW